MSAWGRSQALIPERAARRLVQVIPRAAETLAGARPADEHAPAYPPVATMSAGRAGARAVPAFVALLLALCAWMPAAAGERALLPADTPPVYRQECGACHLAYPPALLPATSWQRVMSGLAQHHGSDATLAAADQERIARWPQAQAGTSRRVREVPPEDRITRSSWFLREHRKVEAAVWKHSAVGSPANCAACHAGAERGRFDEHALRVPPGLDSRLLRAWRD